MNVIRKEAATCVLGLVVLLVGITTTTFAQGSRTATAIPYLQRGQAWMERGENKRALADFELAVASDPSVATAWLARGMARRTEGDLAGALADINQSLKLDWQSAQGHHQRAGTLYLLGRVDEAAADLDAAVRLNPRFAEASTIGACCAICAARSRRRSGITTLRSSSDRA